MADSLPAEWLGKRARVTFTREGSSAEDVALEDQNEQGVFVTRTGGEHPAFIPWTSVMYVQLSEAPDESGFMAGRAE